MIEQLKEKFTKYEVARILGARALQLAMDAPLLLKISEEELERINYNPLEMAKRELIADVLPITVARPMPKKREEKLKPIPVSREEITEIKKKVEKKVEEKEKEAEKQIEESTGKEAPIHSAEIKDDKVLEKEEEKEEEKVTEDAEIMELAIPEDEVEAEAGTEAEED